MDESKIFPSFVRYCMMPSADAYFLNADADWTFATDVTERISWRSTVTFFNMQLAYHLGFDEVYLIGVDHSFKQPKSGVEGTIIKNKGADRNHFHKDYFGDGARWQKADVQAMERVYELAKEAFKQDKRAIFNATDGGHLELFPRVHYERVFDRLVTGGQVVESSI